MTEYIATDGTSIRINGTKVEVSGTLYDRFTTSNDNLKTDPNQPQFEGSLEGKLLGRTKTVKLVGTVSNHWSQRVSTLFDQNNIGLTLDMASKEVEPGMGRYFVFRLENGIPLEARASPAQVYAGKAPQEIVYVSAPIKEIK